MTNVDTNVVISYTNHRGERSLRQIRPVTLMFISTSYHLDHQWILKAWDYQRQDYREFAMKNIHHWGIKDNWKSQFYRGETQRFEDYSEGHSSIDAAKATVWGRVGSLWRVTQENTGETWETQIGEGRREWKKVK